MKPPIVIRIFKGDQLEAVKQFTESQIAFGSNSEVQIQLSGEGVSPLHGTFEERGGQFYVSDLGSESGVFVNGEKTLDSQIESGTEVRIGEFTLHFFIGVPKPIGAPSPSPNEIQSVPVPPPPEEKTLEIQTTEIPGDRTQELPSDESPTERTQEVEIEKESTLDKTEELSQPPVELSTEAPSVKASILGSPGGAKGSASGKTFAPPSYFDSADEFLKPGQGPLLEVHVVWKERVLATYHFNEKKIVHMGADELCEIQLPLNAAGGKFPLLRLDTNPAIRFLPDMTVQVVNEEGQKFGLDQLNQQSRVRSLASGGELDLRQGEMVRLGLWGDTVFVYCRFTSQPVRPLAAPVWDLSTSESTGIILSGVVAAIFYLYMMIFQSSSLNDESLIEEPIRKAEIKFTPPTPPAPKTVVKVDEVKKKKKVVKVVDKPQKKIKQAVKPTVAKKGKAGKASEVAPKKTKVRKKTYTSARSGGAIKTGKKGANMKTKKPDPTKVGLLSTFSSKGRQKLLDKASSGSGELMGMADSATGFSGQAEDREGDQLGSKLKSSGAGGKGSATVGIAGVGTKGRGTGTYGLGSGGIGKKGSVDVNVGGQEAQFTGSMDRDAIRRVILANKSAIRSCYERVLQRKPDLYGKLVLEWDIEERGRVTRTKVVSNSLGDKTVANCIMSRLKTWRFPEPPGDQIGRVTYPFVFTSQ